MDNLLTSHKRHRLDFSTGDSIQTRAFSDSTRLESMRLSYQAVIRYMATETANIVEHGFFVNFANSVQDLPNST